MLADFLLTPKQQRILGAFLLNPARSFAISDIFDLVEGGRSSTQAFIKSLVEAQVLLLDTEHRTTRYTANAAHPLYPELRQIAIKSFGIREPIEAALVELRNQVDRAFIFGSLAKGTDKPDSDVDVMLVGDVRLGKATRALEAAGSKLGREIHVNVYPATEWEELRISDPVVRAIDEGPKIELNIAASAD
ncbi:nucleotidyltransferase domain-containing protein [Paraburkholderia sp. Tr-20389]|uniref:nucleotidyltransferase domain-containing protein n=1 Tax=Paraburkholderia sp. Tr-20389 TaxID=2703903 RepID=UPI00197E9C66|nr:nucleotidyltransferase domain-containing protein [Paraburkholderia sp. Tr-20389]MBN3753017.1 nucleotidyltransferase domain-containing protein [Paraburkholderia sp. Tr-20389]